jgi:hypothetical protein
LKKDILLHLKQDQTAYCSTMLDFYGLGEGFPGTPVPAHLASIAKVRHIEQAIKADICAMIPGFRPDVRLLPYIQLHEYEGLLFSHPAAFAKAINPTLRHDSKRYAMNLKHRRTSTMIANPPIQARAQRLSALSQGLGRNARSPCRGHQFNERSVPTLPGLG